MGGAGSPVPAVRQGLRAARRGLSALPVWELDAGLGLSSGRAGRLPGETAEGPR